MVKRKKNLAPILIGVGALYFLLRSQQAEAISGGNAPLIDRLGIGGTSTPLFSFPNFADFFSTSSTQTEPVISDSSIPIESKKTSLASGFPSPTASFGAGGFTDISGVRVFQDSFGNIIGGESLITQQSITATETKKQISSGGGGSRRVKSTPLTTQVRSSGGSFSGTSSLSGSQATESESRAESLFARISGN